MARVCPLSQRWLGYSLALLQIERIKLNVIDTVDADTLEVGDTIWLDGDEIEVTEFLPGDLDSVSFKGYSQNHDTVEPYTIRYDRRVDLLGV